MTRLAKGIVVLGLAYVILVTAQGVSGALGVLPSNRDGAVTYGAVIRHGSSGPWIILNDGSHRTVGFTGITCLSGGALQVRYDGESTLTNVASVWINPDESLSRRGIIGGASVGLTNFRILFTRLTADGPKPLHCNSSILRGNSTNVWIGLVGTVPQ